MIKSFFILFLLGIPLAEAGDFNICFVTMNSTNERVAFAEKTKGFPSNLAAGDPRIKLFELTLGPAELTPTTYQTPHVRGTVTVQTLEANAPAGGCHALFFSGHHLAWQPILYGQSPPPPPNTEWINSATLNITDIMESQQVCNVDRVAGRTVMPPSFPKLLDNLLETWFFACNTLRKEVVLSSAVPFPATDKAKNNDEVTGTKITDTDRMSIMFGNSYSIAGWDCMAQRGSSFEVSFGKYLNTVKEGLGNRNSFYSEHLDTVQSEKTKLSTNLIPLPACINPDAQKCLRGTGNCELMQTTGANVNPAARHLKDVYCNAVKEFAKTNQDYWFYGPATGASGAPVPDPSSGHYDKNKAYGRRTPCVGWRDNIARKAEVIRTHPKLPLGCIGFCTVYNAPGAGSSYFKCE